MRSFTAAMLAAVLLSSPAYAEPTMISGVPVITDGDTIRIGDTKIRIEGMDAPERDQLCADENFQNYPCGTKATEAMREIVGGKSVDCTISGLDRYGRSLGTCTVDGLDIGQEMVRDGWALAFVRYSKRYVEHEAAARTVKAGMWAGTFLEPWNYRRAKRF